MPSNLTKKNNNVIVTISNVAPDIEFHEALLVYRSVLNDPYLVVSSIAIMQTSGIYTQ